MFQFSGFAFRSLGISRLQRDGFPHSEIRGYNGYLLLPAAYRSLSRPSSPLRAKAFTMRPFLLFSNIILLTFLLVANMSKNFFNLKIFKLKYFNEVFTRRRFMIADYELLIADLKSEISNPISEI